LRLLLLEKQQKWGSQYQCMLHCLCCERLFFLVLWKQYARRQHHIFMANSSSWLRQHPPAWLRDNLWTSMKIAWVMLTYQCQCAEHWCYTIALPSGKLVHKAIEHGPVDL
jgi:hypothetical protein